MHASLITLGSSFPCLIVGKLFVKIMDVLCEILCESSECCNYVLSFRCVCVIYPKRPSEAAMDIMSFSPCPLTLLMHQRTSWNL